MIVRDEAHVITELLDSVASHISFWVIVDTGSVDGTQDVIRDHMVRLGIPGELHERPWRNYGHNRSEALALAQGHCDFILTLDADDVFVGKLTLPESPADLYMLRNRHGNGDIFWTSRLCRDGLPWRWKGVVHESLTCDDPYSTARLEGDYHVQYRQLGNRSNDSEKWAKYAAMLLPEVEKDPEDRQQVSHLAMSFLNAGDYANARIWFARQAEMGGTGEDSYAAQYWCAAATSMLPGEWAAAQDLYLHAWATRPSRAEPLYEIARHHRIARDFRLGYLFAQHASRIPYPTGDYYVRGDIYTWRGVDELAICASQIGEHAEAFALCRKLMALTELPDADRQRISANRDYSVPAMLKGASSRPETAIAGLTPGRHGTDITISLTSGTDRASAEQTLNSFLHNCLDINQVARFLLIDTGLADEDRRTLHQNYPFLEFTEATTPEADPTARRIQINTRYWLHLTPGWQFFAPENYLTRLTGVLEAEPQVVQVGVNFADAVRLTGACAAEDAVRRTPDAGRYVLGESPIAGPVMFDMRRQSAETNGRTATLDEVLCIGKNGS